MLGISTDTEPTQTDEIQQYAKRLIGVQRQVGQHQNENHYKPPYFSPL